MDEMKKEDFEAFANDEVPEGDEPKLGLTPEKVAESDAEYADAFNEPESDVKVKAKDDFDAAMAEADDMQAEKEMDALDAGMTKPVEPAKPTTFKEAFAAARKSGLKVFDWNGKKYTTELKSDKKPMQKAVEAAVDKSVPPPATFPKEPPAKKGMGPALTMLPKEGAPSIYEDRKPKQAKGSGFEDQIPV